MTVFLNRKVLYAVCITVLGLLTLILSTPWSSDDSGRKGLLKELPVTPEPDADSPADTIKTLTAAMTSLVQEIDNLNQANEAIRLANEELSAKTDLIEVRVSERLRTELRNQQSSHQQLADEINRMTRQFDGLSRTNGANGFVAEFQGLVSAPHASQELHWVEPMESQFGSGSVVSLAVSDKPRYTIPQNATLVNSTTMTAMIGRVPVENRVVDPLPFKVVTGADNLAANGFKIDGLDGSIWSGFAVGDWALACVAGTLTSVTFVFEDGRIRSIGENSHGGERIGWISDAKGVPCIGGDRKTNVRSWLLAQLGASATGSAAEALASTNRTLKQNAAGFKEAFISGDIREFVLGNSIAGTSRSLAQWLASRASQEFDAIFVPTDQTVAIHVDQPLHLDYEQQGRKLKYEERAKLDGVLAFD